MARTYVRRPVDRTPALRHSVQAAFLVLNVWIGVQFYLWVRFFESGGASAHVSHPAGVEGWLPIAALMNLKYLIVTRTLPEIHPAGLFLLVAFLTMSLLFRKAFCSWLCPIGTISEWLWEGGRELWGRTFALPRWIDVPLRSLKYLLMAFFVVVVYRMPAVEVREFLASPYGLIVDVKMLDFFRDAGQSTVIVCGVLIVLSVLTRNFWCRYLCPYGALMGLTSLAGPARITRDPAACIDCGKCAHACPSLIPVDVLRTVRTPECTGCLMCVSVCPVNDALDLRTHVRRARIPGPWVAIGVTAIFLIVTGGAIVFGAWNGHVPESVFFDLIPNASIVRHR